MYARATRWMWKLRCQGWWASSLGGSSGPFQVTGKGRTFGWRVSHHNRGAQRECSWSRLVGTSSLWSDGQLGSPLFSNATPSSSLESPLLIHLASSLPTEELGWSSRWQKASILPSVPALLQCIQGRLEPGRSLYSTIMYTGLRAQGRRKWGGP